MSAITQLRPLYHVPRSQVWRGSRGRQAGRVHLHTVEPFHFNRIRREAGRALCGRLGWYERPPCEGEEVCGRCAAIATAAGCEVADGEGET